jgi:hypothetical protein
MKIYKEWLDWSLGGSTASLDLMETEKFCLTHESDPYSLVVQRVA